MALISKVCLNNHWVSIYRAKNGNTIHIVKDGIPNILSRTRTLTLDPNGKPIKCKDIMVKDHKIVSADIYTGTKDGNTVLKDKDGITKLLTNLRFLDIAAKFLK